MASTADVPSVFLAKHVYCPVSPVSTPEISSDPLSWTVNLGPSTDSVESSLLLIYSEGAENIQSNLQSLSGHNNERSTTSVLNVI